MEGPDGKIGKENIIRMLTVSIKQEHLTHASSPALSKNCLAFIRRIL